MLNPLRTFSSLTKVNALKRFRGWCDVQHILAPKLSLVPVVEGKAVDIKLPEPKRKIEELKALLRERGLSDSGTRSVLLHRLGISLDDCISEMTVEELTRRLIMKGSSTKGGKADLISRLEDCMIKDQLGGSPLRIAVVSNSALETDGIYAAIPVRLVICKSAALSTNAGISLKLPWPQITEPEGLNKRKQWLKIQFEEIFCVALFLISQFRDPNSMWRVWLDLLPPQPDQNKDGRIPINVFYFNHEQIASLRASYIFEEVCYIVELFEEWFELFVDEDHVRTVLKGPVSKEEFRWACALILSRAYALPDWVYFQGGNCGVIPFADFMDHRRHDGDTAHPSSLDEVDIDGAQDVREDEGEGTSRGGGDEGAGGGTEEGPSMTVEWQSQEDSMVVKQAMRQAFGLVPETGNDAEACVFLGAIRNVHPGELLYSEYGRYDNAQSLVIHGFVDRAEHTVIHLHLVMDEAVLEANMKLLGVDRVTAIIMRLMRQGSDFLETPLHGPEDALAMGAGDSPGETVVPPMVWMLPGGQQGRRLLRMCLQPLVRLQTPGASAALARSQLRLMFENKLKLYSGHTASDAENPFQKLIGWEANLVRFYLDAINELDDDENDLLIATDEDDASSDPPASSRMERAWDMYLSWVKRRSQKLGETPYYVEDDEARR